MNKPFQAVVITLLSAFAIQANADNYGGNPCQNPQASVLTVEGVTSGASGSGVSIITGVAGAQTYICSMYVSGTSGTNPTFSLEYGLGTNCTSSSGALTPNFPTVANTFYPFSGPVVKAASGSGVCYEGGGTSPVQNYLINYVQQ